MDLDGVSDLYFAQDARLASFQVSQPAAKRKSNAKGKAGKTLAWPHRHLDPDSLSRAGFYFDPTPEYRDNTICFLCSRKVGGWEDGDNPFEEHLRLSPHCGWAIVSAIEIGLGDYCLDDPAHPQMVEARKATFGGRWPHEGKRGWKCKTKQMVEAGWKYTPTTESEDMATCTYCQLALDGWEPKDNPMHEHYKRSPGCQFFRLLNQYQQAPTKKSGRGKGARTSKASRLSVQSVTTTASDGTLLLDHTADHEDSVMTTTSVMTQGSTKRGRAKKATTARGKKTRTRKDEAVEVLEDPPETYEEAPEPQLAKPTRGRKRTSDAMDDSTMTTAEAPPPKKRATRGRQSSNVDASIVDQQRDVEMAEAKLVSPPKTKGKKGRGSNARTKRKVSTASTVSITSLPDVDDDHIMDEEELNRQLEADFDRPLSDDENIAADSDSERKKAPAKSKRAPTKKGASKKQEDTQDHHSMFDPTPVEVDEAAVDAELKALEAEMEMASAETLQVPKKGRKAGTRKVSKQTTKKTKKTAPVEPEPEPEPVSEMHTEAADVDELAEGHEESMISNATVLNKRASSLSSVEPPKRKRGRPSKKASLVKTVVEEAEPADPGPAIKSSSSPKMSHVNFSEPDEVLRGETPTTSPPPRLRGSPSLSTAAAPAPEEEGEELPQPPTSPVAATAATASTPAAKQATISPSQSPQSSDAENQPPSSRPSNSTSSNSSRPALAPVLVAAVKTPMRGYTSPSKNGGTMVRSMNNASNNNTIANLQTSHPWSCVDLDLVFENLGLEGSNKENAAGIFRHLGGGGAGSCGGDLTSPEKRMTVEEWIYHNASQAEQKMRLECEAMVTAFEREGTRAMTALEGLVVD